MSPDENSRRAAALHKMLAQMPEKGKSTLSHHAQAPWKGKSIATEMGLTEKLTKLGGEAETKDTTVSRVRFSVPILMPRRNLASSPAGAGTD